MSLKITDTNGLKVKKVNDSPATVYLFTDSVNAIGLSGVSGATANYQLPADGSPGQVLSTDGFGLLSWIPNGGGSGANTSLSNLTTTSVNQSLTFDTGADVLIKTKDDTTTKALSLSSGLASAGNSSFVSLFSGDATGNTGNINVYSGSSSSSGNSGTVTIFSGNTVNGTTGNVDILTGNGVGAGSGQLNITTGTATTTGQSSGNANLKSGSSDGTSGSVNVASGPSTNNDTGSVLLESGIPNVGNSGNVVLRSGAPLLGNSGSTTVRSGDATNTGATSGVVLLKTGDSDSTSGDLTLFSGTSTSGNSGNLVLSPGTAGGTRGKVRFQDGSEGTPGYTWTSTDSSGSGTWKLTSPQVLQVNNGNSNISVTPSTNQIVIFGVVETDETGGYNSSTGIWTAPSAGKVEVSAAVNYVNPQEGAYYIGLQHVVAGPTTKFRFTQSIWASTNANNGIVGCATSGVFKVAAGDTVAVATRAENSGPFPVTSANLIGGILTGGNDGLNFSLFFKPD